MSWKKGIPGAVKLGFRGNYGDLAGGSRRLRHLRLGRTATNWARHVLANFDVATGDVTQLKRALAILVITVCESARFPHIRKLIEDGWLTGAYFTETEEKYVVHWRTFSCAILSYQVSHDWYRASEAQDLDSLLDIKSLQQALSQVDMLLQSRQCLNTVFVYR